MLLGLGVPCPTPFYRAQLGHHFLHGNVPGHSRTPSAPGLPFPSSCRKCQSDQHGAVVRAAETVLEHPHRVAEFLGFGPSSASHSSFLVMHTLNLVLASCGSAWPGRRCNGFAGECPNDYKISTCPCLCPSNRLLVNSCLF